jgi:hypothetical protein
VFSLLRVVHTGSGAQPPTCSRWFLARGFFYPEDGGDTFPRNVGSQDLDGAASKKTAFFIVTSVENPKSDFFKGCLLKF